MHLDSALAALLSVSIDLVALTDSDLLALSTEAARLRQLADVQLATIAGEIARRSSRELGSDGLAQRLGMRTPEELVRVTNRSTSRDAATAVRVGRLVTTPDEPWFESVSRSVREGLLPVESADAIRSGLGVPAEGVEARDLAAAAEALCRDAAVLDPDRLLRRARQARDELDEAGVSDREAARYAKRSLRVTRLPDGMSRAMWLMDPETSALVTGLFDRATSPRRGGPRFVGDEGVRAFAAIESDGRTTEQLASDVFLQLLLSGADADSSQLLGSGGASVTVHVDAAALAARTGRGYLEGQPDAASIATVERLACSGGVVEVAFGADGNPLDLGREQRLFSQRQRRALAARDGGCLMPGCERPPSWTEAHHIQHWARDGGRTDIADGVLLCRHHHLLLHNNGWEIVRQGGERWLIPPTSVDPRRGRVLLRSKNPVRRGAA